MSLSKPLRTPLILLLACGVVALLAGLGKFTSMMGFPWIFAGVCLVLGLLSLREHAGEATGLRAALVLAASALALSGGFAQHRLAKARIAATQAEVSAALVGTAAPPLSRLEALNTPLPVLERAASYSARATIVTFWARWCSPCWTELPELDEFLARHAEDGLAVVAITQYDEPDNELARGEQFARDQEFVGARGFGFPFAITRETAIYRDFMLRSIPSTALIDRSGTIVAYGVGVDGGREVMRRAEALLAET